MSEPQLLLSAKNLSKTYRLGKRSLPVLQQVSLDVERGAFIALQGSSGAGKSTFLHLLGGLDKPDEGSIEVDGQNLATLSNSGLSRFRNERIGFIFQAYHLLPEFDALENVCIPARMVTALGAPP